MRAGWGRAVNASADLAARLDAFPGARVVCVGDVMLDRFVYGDVSRISPEAPIPVLRVASESGMLGGAGNVVRNLVALGAAVDFVSVTGDDAPRAEVTALVGALQAVEALLIADAERDTTIKTRYVAEGQQLLRADRETPAPVDDAIADAICARAEERMQGVGALILSDYGKGVLTPAMIERLITAARSQGVAVIVDPKGDDYALYRGASLITPNRRELEQASRMPTAGDDAVIAAARHVIESCGIDSVLATRGADGMTLVGKDGASHFAAVAREVFDVSGAGDTVVAVMAAGQAAGVPEADAARLANVAAGIVVGRHGTAVARADEVRAALRESDQRTAGAKIVSQAAALERVAEYRARRQRVGFTNGVFDLLHPGHVSLIAQARAACDRLVVGLNSDASVRRLKGPERPVQTETARAVVLASLADVDLVAIFSDDTPMALIEAIRPDVLIKGADYAVDQVVGGSLVQGYGGRVLLADLAPGHSTTGTIEKLAR